MAYVNFHWKVNTLKARLKVQIELQQIYTIQPSSTMRQVLFSPCNLKSILLKFSDFLSTQVSHLGVEHIAKKALQELAQDIEQPNLLS